MKVCGRGRDAVILMVTLAFVVALAGNLGATQYILYNLDATTTINTGGDTAYGINNLGQVVGGISGGAGPGQAWIWDWNTKVKTPLTIASGYTYSMARGINDSGLITGTSSKDGNPVYDNTAFSYNTKTGDLQLLSTTSGHSSDAYAINNSGQIVGTSYTYDEYLYINSIRAFKYDGTMNDLGTLPDYVDSDNNHYPLDISQAFAINNSGQAAGLSGGGWCYPQGVLFSNGTVQNLGNLAGVTDPRDTHIYTFALGMNENGDVVGHSEGRAFLYTSTGGIRGLTPEGVDSVAYDINNHGQVVGKMGSYAYLGGTAFIWTEEGGMQYLQDLVVNKDDLAAIGGYLEVATAINEQGWIVGAGPHAFLLVPTPIPGSLLLLGTGLLGLGAVGWRRKRR